MSDEYDYLKGLSKSFSDELQRMSSTLEIIEKRAELVEAQVESLLQYSYQYNLKLFGVPQVSRFESALELTSKVCVKLFHKISI